MTYFQKMDLLERYNQMTQHFPVSSGIIGLKEIYSNERRSSFIEPLFVQICQMIYQDILLFRQITGPFSHK